MKKLIKKNNLGYNGCCSNCGKIQDGGAKQPYIVYYKRDDEKRGNNLIVCSEKCAKDLIESIK
jgi:hypothetical protein